ncbi:MAG: endosialidase [Eubacterium sp.]|nr:endosialidase [Eubacterium sp.]
MAIIKELIKKESNGTISFGNYQLDEKKKLSDFEVSGDMYKVKTWSEITKLERNGTFVYESIPGTAVNVFKETAEEVSFFVDGTGNTQITLELESNKEYKVIVGERELGVSKTDIGGKLTFDVELHEGAMAMVKVIAA